MTSINKPVDLQHPYLCNEIDDCIRLMVLALRGSSYNPVGISAPQVGFNYRIIAFKDHYMGGLTRIVANPEIKGLGEFVSKEREGCLSNPGKWVKVARLGKIELRGFDFLKDEHFKDNFGGVTAATIQHELDHINSAPWPPNERPKRHKQMVLGDYE